MSAAGSAAIWWSTRASSSSSVDTTGLDLDPNGKGIVKVNNLSTTLTEAGAEAFAGFYEPGTAFDPISAKFKIAG